MYARPIRQAVLCVVAAVAFVACSPAAVSPGVEPSLRSFPSRIALPATLPTALSYDEAMTLFAYDYPLFNVETRSVEKSERVTVRDIMYDRLGGGRLQALLVEPQGSGPFGGVVYVHGAAGSSVDFLDEAVELASHGVVSLLVTQPEGYARADDPNSPVTEIVFEIRELRRAVDLVAAQPHVVGNRLGFVGYSFGAVRGAVLAGAEGNRLSAAILSCLNPSYGSRTMASFDPIVWLPHVSPAELLIQLGREDAWSTGADGDRMLAAALDPKNLVWYDAGHGLNAKARADRIAFLARLVGDG